MAVDISMFKPVREVILMRIILATVLLSLLAGPAFYADPAAAQTPPADKQGASPGRRAGSMSGRALPKDKLLEIDRVQKEIADVNSMHWAWRIKNTGDITYDKLVVNSANWTAMPETKAMLLGKIKDILDAGTARALTAEEQERFEKGKAKARSILQAGKPDTPAMAARRAKMERVDEINSTVFDIEARYWASRIKNSKDITYEQMEKDSRRWFASPGAKTALLAKVKELLDSGDVIPLDEPEKAKMAEAKVRAREILKQSK